MKNLTTTTYNQVYLGGLNTKIDKVIVHTSTSCYMVDKIFCTIHGENADEIAKLVIKLYEAVEAAEGFISGFEGDESQEGINDLLLQLRDFDLQTTE